MAYSEEQAKRVRSALAAVPHVEERAMFGGLSFLSAGRMVCGILGDELVVRVGAARYEESLARPHTRPMDFTGRVMRGWVYVAPAGYASDGMLAQWIAAGLDYAEKQPPKAKRDSARGGPTAR